MLIDRNRWGRCSFTRGAVAVVGAVSVGYMASDRIAQQREDVHFKVLRLLESRPDASQREIAEELGVSLGAINFCINALIDKGHIKLANFRGSKNKLGYVYVLTPEGVAHRAQLAAGFIRRKMVEFEAIQAELDQLHCEFAQQPATLPHD